MGIEFESAMVARCEWDMLYKILFDFNPKMIMIGGKYLMMDCIIRTKIDKSNTRYTLLSGLIIIYVWKLLTLNFSPLVVATIRSVINSIITIFTGIVFYKMIVLTVTRLIIGFNIGITIGVIIGILMKYSKLFKGITIQL